MFISLSLSSSLLIEGSGNESVAFNRGPILQTTELRIAHIDRNARCQNPTLSDALPATRLTDITSEWAS